MSWFRVHDGFHSHPAVRAALLREPSSLALWTLAGSWSAAHRTDGHVPTGLPPLLVDDHATRATEALTRHRLWRRAKGGWAMQPAVPAAAGCRPIQLWSIERDDYRKKIPHDVRDLVYERDERRCVECGSTHDLTLDHVHPWSRGGPDTVENLRVLCRPCNSSKGARA